jgi:peroxiredoxin
MAIIIALAGVFVVAGGWLGWQLLRQNGRMLLRLEEMEKRLDELEFGKGDAPEGLPAGSDAPAFELPDLAGNGRALAEFRGQPLLVIFFNPVCGFCRDLLPRLAATSLRSSRREEAQSEMRGPDDELDQSLVTSAATDRRHSRWDVSVLIISTGGAEANRQLFDEHKIVGPVLLQKESEVAAAYQANGTPSGYLINPEGKITSELAMGAEALLALASEPGSNRRQEAPNSPPQPLTLNSQSDDQSLLTSAATGNGDNRNTRFTNRSLARSKIKRDGLKAGAMAPDFRLPRLDGRGELTLSELRGRRVLLVFSSPGCGPCNMLAPALEKLHRSNRRPAADSLSSNGGEGKGEEAEFVQIVLISKGEPKENRAKVKEHGLTFPVVLQQHWEISRLYAMFATPVAYLIDESGVITHDVAVGVDQILALFGARMEVAAQSANERA